MKKQIKRTLAIVSALAIICLLVGIGYAEVSSLSGIEVVEGEDLDLGVIYGVKIDTISDVQIVYGYFRDIDTEEGIEGAVVMLMNLDGTESNFGGVTDTNGYFEIEASSGIYDVRVFANNVGYAVA